MPVLLQNGAVFLHIPKTGGTWVSQTLRRLGLFRCSIGAKHANFPRMLATGRRGAGRRLEHTAKRLLFLRTRPRPFTFCFVRHPLSWYESFYSYKSRPDTQWERDGEWDSYARWHPNAVLNGLGEGRDFNEFVEAVIEQRPGYVTSLYEHYTFQPVDFVGRQEQLREDLAAVLEKMGCEFDRQVVLEAKRVNTSRAPGERPEWDEALRQRVLELERPALLRYGYEEG
jgi:hypothetical protein